SAKARVGGLELGALVAEPELLPRFLRHCSPRRDATASDVPASATGAAAAADPDANFACAEPRLAGLHSRRCEKLWNESSGRGSPCDFVSLHEYKHAAFAVDQLAWARRTALAIDPQFFAALRVVAFESAPDWNPTRDPATRSMYFGNGYLPGW